MSEARLPRDVPPVTPADAQLVAVEPQLVRPRPRSVVRQCRVCRGTLPEGMPLCPTCQVIQGQLGWLHLGMEPISLYRKPSLLRDWLTYYKPGGDEFTPKYGLHLQQILHGFFNAALERQDPWSPAAFDCFTVVPSTRRTGVHPLVPWATSAFTAFGLAPAKLLSPGPDPVGHRLAAKQGFVATGGRGRTVLLLDDVYTTGARAHSAALALIEGGADVRVVVPIGRRINPDFSPGDSAYWNFTQAPRP